MFFFSVNVCTFHSQCAVLCYNLTCGCRYSVSNNYPWVEGPKETLTGPASTTVWCHARIFLLWHAFLGQFSVAYQQLWASVPVPAHLLPAPDPQRPLQRGAGQGTGGGPCSRTTQDPCVWSEWIWESEVITKSYTERLINLRREKMLWTSKICFYSMSGRNPFAALLSPSLFDSVYLIKKNHHAHYFVHHFLQKIVFLVSFFSICAVFFVSEEELKMEGNKACRPSTFSPLRCMQETQTTRSMSRV